MVAKPTLSERVAKKWRDLRTYLSVLGAIPAVTLILAELSTRIQERFPRVRFPAWTVSMRIALLEHPFRLRLFTSDAAVFRQTFVERHYRNAELSPGSALVIDLGANIGTYAALTLSRDPNVRVVCVEPDPDNAALARTNLAPYGRRVDVIATAVWDEATPLRLLRYGTGYEWGVQVRPCLEGEPPDMTAVTIDEILAREDASHVGILKVDIEGAEENLFAGEVPWLQEIDLVAIELHSAEARRVIEDRLPAEEWSHQQRGEIDLFIRS